jgi:hypothetical protein
MITESKRGKSLEVFSEFFNLWLPKLIFHNHRRITSNLPPKCLLPISRYDHFLLNILVTFIITSISFFLK